MKITLHYIVLFFILQIFNSCSINKSVAGKYYKQHRTALDSIQQLYKKTVAQKQLAVGFVDKELNDISIEITTDTLKYIYSFGLDESRLADTLTKYKFNAAVVVQLISQMKAIHCVWMNTVDYYDAGKKTLLTFISIKPVGFNFSLGATKYYILIYFPNVQNYKKRRLLDNKKFKRVTDNVAYTVSSAFR